jgi:hypothetical protein
MDMTGAAMKKIVTIALVVFGLAAPMSAAPITGKLNFTGSVRVSSSEIDWLPLNTGEGVIFTTAPGTEYFSAIYDSTFTTPYEGDSIDLSGQSLPLAEFLNDFEENPIEVPSEYDNLSFTLTEIVAPTAPPCTGGEGINVDCSLGVFTLKQTEEGVAVNFSVEGFFVDPQFTDPNFASGVYTTQLIGDEEDTIAEIIAILDNPTGSITSSFSATYTASAIPEPATLLTFGAGSVLLAAHRRRRAKKNHA